MFFKKPDLTSGSRPILISDETLLFVQDNVGLYEGKYKIATCQKGHAYLTSHRACYIDDVDPKNCSLAVDLRDVDRHELQARFLRSSPKVTLYAKPVKNGLGTVRRPISGQSPLVQRAVSSSLPGSRTQSPFRGSSVHSQSPPVSAGTWICPICSFPNPVPSNFEPTTVTESFPLPPCLTCGIKPPFSLVLKAAIAASSKRSGLTKESNWQAPATEGGVAGRLSLHEDQSPSTFSDTIICPRCTFHNHPSLQNCEICGASLPRTGSKLDMYRDGEIIRSESPGPEISGLDIEIDHDSGIVKFSFRAGGERIFYERLQNAMVQRKWLLQDAPPIPTATESINSQLARTDLAGKDSIGSRPQSTPVGIAGLEQRGLRSRKNNEAVLGGAFEDLEALMASAKDVVALAEKFAAESGTGSAANPLLSDSAVALGMVATKDLLNDRSTTLYISELARNIAEFVTDGTRAVLRKQGGVMGLIDLWAIFNRSRNGVELVSPADFRNAAEAWARLGLPVKLREFKSGFLAVQGLDWNDDKTVTQLVGWLNSLQRSSPPNDEVKWDWAHYGCGITAQEAASRFGWSIGVANEELEMAEDRGVLCREEGIEGLKFWLNYFVVDD